MHALLGECDDGVSRGQKLQSELAPDFFQLTSLALRQGLTSNLPLSSWAQVYPNSSALQRRR